MPVDGGSSLQQSRDLIVRLLSLVLRCAVLHCFAAGSEGSRWSESESGAATAAGCRRGPETAMWQANLHKTAVRTRGLFGLRQRCTRAILPAQSGSLSLSEVAMGWGERGEARPIWPSIGNGRTERESALPRRGNEVITWRPQQQPASSFQK